MKKWILAAAILGAVSLQTAGATPLSLAFSSAIGATISFDGAGHFSFPDTGNDFQINLVTGGTNSALGLFGNINGTFTIGAISAISGGETAPVTGSGTLSINDGSTNLTANLQWLNITTTGTSSGLNETGMVNLSSITYSGSNTDLVALKTALAGSGTLNFTFNPSFTLDQLDTQAHATTYSGTIMAAPEPVTFSLMGIGLLGIGLLRKRLS